LKEHYNFIGRTITNESFFVSLRFENLVDHILLRYVLRLKDGNYNGNIRYDELKEPTIGELFEQIDKNLKILEIHSVQHPQVEF
jgi:hypothetical protein